ncbi:hypothetical protein [Moraxella marmotae]|uniref:hypothetical protein n=1 Tax=Moraxella marmotae TaxID=3344520 RepID=UPI0035F3F0B1
MKKYLIMPMIAAAMTLSATAVAKPNHAAKMSDGDKMVGIWQCHFADNDMRIQGYLNYQKDGTAHAVMKVDYLQAGKVTSTNLSRNLLHWQLSGDQLQSDDWQILDLKSYDESGQPLGEEYAQLMRSIATQNANITPQSTSRIQFIDNDTYHEILDEATGEYGLCHRQR